MRLPLLVVAVVLAAILGGGFYAARPPERSPVPTIELRTAERATERRGQARERPRRVSERSGGNNDPGGGPTGATPVPALAPAPAEGGGDDDDDDADDDDGDEATDG